MLRFVCSLLIALPERPISLFRISGNNYNLIFTISGLRDKWLLIQLFSLTDEFWSFSEAVWLVRAQTISEHTMLLSGFVGWLFFKKNSLEYKEMIFNTIMVCSVLLILEINHFTGG